MGHKVHPNGFRLGVYRNWESKWFAPDKEYQDLLLEDVRLRNMLLNRLKNAGVARVETERSASALTITLHTAKPGIVIGKGGTSVDQLRDELERTTGKRVRVTIQEIKKPELSAQLVAESVAAQLEKRIAFRRALKQALMKTMRAGAQGAKIRVKGRLGGSEMARVEWSRDGRVPLHTLKADIDFGQSEAKTTFGRIGVSAWVYTGDFPTEALRRKVVAEEPAEGEVSIGATLAQAPAELLGAATVATAVAPEAGAEPAASTLQPAEAPTTPASAAAAPATRRRRTATAVAPAGESAEKPKRTRRTATKASAETTEKPAARRTARTPSADSSEAKAPAPRRTPRRKE